jgi:hypothetical protein
LSSHGNLVFYILYIVWVGALLGALVIAFRGLKPRADDPKGIRSILWLPVLQFLLVGLVLGFSPHGEMRPSSTSDDSDMFPISETDLALLVERANHLEEMLGGGLLVFFIAAAGGALAVRTALRGESESTSFSARQLFYGITLGYVFVSGFYYYMLAQYYASMSTVLKVISSDSAYADVYKGLQIPTLGLPLDPASNIVMLLFAPLFPLAVSYTLSFGSYLSLRHSRAGLAPKDLTRSLALHAVLCPLLVCHAFAGFLLAGPLAPKGITPREDQQEEQPYSNSPAVLGEALAGGELPRHARLLR